MTDKTKTSPSLLPDPDEPEPQRHISDYERKLRRAVARYREEKRISREKSNQE